ncbi:hypothetical protein AWB85_21935 [Mycobacteroides immunogenum]|uniref:HTH asnC-type domain-containing protein n=1 Tax=Mycobacteroides immunogenum TaxID=83262 RepID=A0A179VE68_9MYCO|nr:hypothetical protein AWB85_21935 [Mycobacteroides immunogenum]
MRDPLGETDRRIATALIATPRATWRELAAVVNLSERTVVRHVAPLYADKTLRATAIQNPFRHPGIRPTALRIRCRGEQSTSIAQALARRSDILSVDTLGGGEELMAIVFLDGATSRDDLLLRALPSGTSWSTYRLLHVFVSRLDLAPLTSTPPALSDVDSALIHALSQNGRASYRELARQTNVSDDTARRRLETLLSMHAVRPVTEVDLTLLGIEAEALLWLNVRPAALESTGLALAAHPSVRFTAITTGPTNLLAAVFAPDMNEMLGFLTDTVSEIPAIMANETTPILEVVKRSGLLRRGRVR